MKPAPSVLVMFSAGLGLASVIAIGSIGSAQKKDEPTQVQVGVMTPRQRVHSKLFGNYVTGRTLDVPRLQKRPGKEAGEATEDGVYLGPGIPVTSPDVPVLSFVDFLKDLSCEADATIIATAKDRTSQLTENREFLFSEYVVTVEEVLQNNPSAHLTATSALTVVRPGGRVQIKGRIVSAVDSSFMPLDTAKRYLLVLKYVPETGAYRSLRNGSFLIQDDELIALTEEQIPGGPGDTRAFSAEARSVLTSGCERNR